MKRMLLRSAHYGVLTLFAVLLIYPLYFAVSASLMTPAEINRYPTPIFPSGLYVQNFIDTIAAVPILRFIVNSFAVATFIMVGQLVFCSMAAYAFALLNFPGKNLWFILFLSTMMIPWEVTIIPNYLLIRGWEWDDTYAGLTIPFMASAFGVFLLRQNFMQFPKELFEAARIDGCGIVMTFLRIVVPLARPALATLGIYSFLNAWNMYLWPLLITNSDRMRTVQIGISMLQWEESQSWNLVLTGVTLALVPSILLLVVGLKQLVQGITAGAVKG
ncbi:carbohydrate ABC transporter permease [Paenibacillaceae bacterium WGS1546]|uniref:carbohydrate ABC transporter permease n=1 Tax=Cohnella sp. WGS1546 TaxID=3366810 RepID=UPI00372D30EE